MAAQIISTLDSKDTWAEKFYAPDLKEVPPLMREVLENYSGIAPDDVIPHILKIRAKGWETFRYPCIGGFSFLEFMLPRTKYYDEIVQRLKSGELLLDLGCCFGQDLRKLAYDGAPMENVYGCDLRPDFFELGYALFRDRKTLRAHLIGADIFDKESKLHELDGKVDILVASSFFHLFDEERLKKVGKTVLKLLHKKKGSMILGRQVANPTAGPHRLPGARSEMFLHSTDSWIQFWQDLAKEEQVKIDVRAEFETNEAILQKMAEDLRAGGNTLMKFLIKLE